jgi:hypothetical protein
VIVILHFGNAVQKILLVVRSFYVRQLDQLIELTIVTVKRVFKENGFRFLPKLAGSAFASG